jgi:hypothetical protein
VQQFFCGEQFVAPFCAELYFLAYHWQNENDFIKADKR